jgi:hypothetical protein
MWFTLLVMGVAVSLEPFRIGMTVLMLNRPRPLRQLLAFLCGGFAMGLTVGLVVLFAVRPTLLGAAHFTLPRVQLVIGGLALVTACVLVTGLRLRRGGDDPGRLATWGRRLADGGSPWVAAVAGLGIALPSIDYLAALAVILASAAPALTQTAALVAFNVVAFALVEIPLVAYLVAPGRTRAAMEGLHAWLRSRRRRDVAGLLAAIGAVLIVAGLVGL